MVVALNLLNSHKSMLPFLFLFFFEWITTHNWDECNSKVYNRDPNICFSCTTLTSSFIYTCTECNQSWNSSSFSHRKSLQNINKIILGYCLAIEVGPYILGSVSYPMRLTLRLTFLFCCSCRPPAHRRPWRKSPHISQKGLWTDHRYFVVFAFVFFSFVVLFNLNSRRYASKNTVLLLMTWVDEPGLHWVCLENLMLQFSQPTRQLY